VVTPDPAASADMEELLKAVLLPAEPVAGAAGPASVTERAAALAALVPVLASSARRAGLGAVTAGRWLADEVTELAPRVSFRDAKTLRRQFGELDDIAIAERLVASAKRTTAAIGAAAGGLSAVEFTAPPLLLAAPIQLAAETIAVTVVELRLVAELHEIMGNPASGAAGDRATAYLMAWVRRRAISATAQSDGVGLALGAAARKELRVHLLRKIGRSSTSLAPFLAGAAAGAELNRRSTKQLGDTLLAELKASHAERWFRPL
jgi:hypothetical protein